MLSQGVEDRKASQPSFQIHLVMMTLRQSATTAANQGVLPNAAIAGQPANITNPGVPLSFVTEKRMRMLTFYINHLLCIQRPFQPNQATLG